MNENKKVSFIYSWPVIILALCFFWPAGVFLIIRRVAIDKKFALSVGKLIGVLGICSYVMAVLLLLACIAGGFAAGDFGVLLFFGIAGFVLRKLAKKIKDEADSIKQYLAIIVNGNVRQLDNIAATTGKSYDIVKKDIQKMMQKGYLKNAYIDESTHEIVLPMDKPIVVTQTNHEGTAQIAKPVTKVVACPCCGANNTIVGAGGECDYCGAPLQ